jgi:hypothetical protein
MPDPGRFLNFFGNPIVRVAGAAKESKPGLQFSESLWAQGNAEAAIRAEGLTKSDTPTRTTWSSMRLFIEQCSDRRGDLHLPRNLCKTFSRLFPMNGPSHSF